jgi:phosphate transport system substrate-binding protein
MVLVTGGGSVRGLKSLVVGTADLAMATNIVPEDLEKVIKDRKLKLTRHDVYRDAVVPVVHPSNPIADLPMGKLRDIFRGAIANWKEVGGKDAPIAVVSQPGTSGTFETFKREVLGEDAVVTPKAKVVGPKELEKTVVENAIGYIGLHQVGGLKALTVNGVAANAESIAAGRYPIRRQLSLYQRDPGDAVVSSFVAYFLAPDKGQAVVRALGDVPMK